MSGTLRTAGRWMRQAAVRGMVLAVRAYQATISPFLGTHCRYTPTCSQYAIEALRRHGPLRGAVLAAWRIVRCHPWARGGRDPVPPARGEG